LGSFANVFIYRYPLGLSLSRPGSHCPHCGNAVRWRHNVPVLGWLVLRGRCYDCGERISVQYPLVEAVFGLLAAALVWRFGPAASTWVYLLLFEALMLGAIVDWKTQYLYDVITLPLGLVGLGVSFAFPQLLGGRWQSPLAMLGMLGTMLAMQGLGRWLAGRDALGGGDVKLLTAAAGFLGWPGAWIALLLGSLFGLPLLFLYRRLHGGAWKDPVPFGPALAMGCAVAAWDVLSETPKLAVWLGFGPL